MTKKVDFTKPIEAVNDDGRVYPATVDAGNPRGGGTNDQRWHVTVQGATSLGVVLDDGTNWGKFSDSWRIRNVQTQPRTISSDLEKANDLLWRLVDWETSDTSILTPILLDAKAYLATQPQPVDRDLLEAREIVASQYEAQKDFLDADHRTRWAGHCRAGEYDNAREVTSTLAGIKHGRGA